MKLEHVTGNNTLARSSSTLSERLKTFNKNQQSSFASQLHCLQGKKIVTLDVPSRGPQTPQTDGALMGTHTQAG